MGRWVHDGNLQGTRKVIKSAAGVDACRAALKPRMPYEPGPCHVKTPR
jgi:hypothetical protein